MRIRFSTSDIKIWLVAWILLSSPIIILGQTVNIEAAPTYINYNRPSTQNITLPNLNLRAAGSKLDGTFRLSLPSGLAFVSAVDDASIIEVTFLRTNGIANQLEIKTTSATDFISLRVTVALSNGFAGALDIGLIDGDADSQNPIGLIESTQNFGNVVSVENYEDDHGAIRPLATEFALDQSIAGNLVSQDSDGFLVEITEYGKLTLTLSQIEISGLFVQGPDRCLIDFTVEESEAGLVLQTETLSPGSYFIDIRGGIFSSGSYILGNSFEPGGAPNVSNLLSNEPFKFGYEINRTAANEVNVGEVQIKTDFNMRPLGTGFRIIAPDGISFGAAESDNQRIFMTRTEVSGFPRLLRADTNNNGTIDTLNVLALCHDTTISFTAIVEDGFSGELLFEIRDGWFQDPDEPTVESINQLRSLGRVALEPEVIQNLPIASNGNLAVFDTATALLHLPILLSDGQVFWVDLSYSGRGKFTVAGFAPTIAFSPLYANFEASSGALLIRNVAIFSEGELGSERFNLVLELDSSGEEFQILSIENRF